MPSLWSIDVLTLPIVLCGEMASHLRSVKLQCSSLGQLALLVVWPCLDYAAGCAFT